jgi:enamine deaminase RidA (YjgF/YER057c/UK114 family)
MAKTFALMEEHMLAPSGNKPVAGGPSSRLSALGIALPTPPTPLGAYVESSAAGNLLFLSGTLPVASGKLAISGRLGQNLSVKDGQEAARIAALNALAAAKEHFGDLDLVRKLVRLTVLIASTDTFAEHASVADGASDLFVQIFGQDAGHVRLVYGVQSLPIGAPVIVDTIFEIEPVPQPSARPTHGRTESKTTSQL